MSEGHPVSPVEEVVAAEDTARLIGPTLMRPRLSGLDPETAGVMAADLFAKMASSEGATNEL